MGFYLRKGINLGKGFRLNLSKSGIGISGGVKGVRISSNSKGTTLNCGKNGVYYRKKLSKCGINSNVVFWIVLLVILFSIVL